jgi:hypothetical protein
MKVKTNVKAGQVLVGGSLSQSNSNQTTQTNTITA